MLGAAVLCGAALSATTGLGRVFAVRAPSAFRAVTSARTLRPTSAWRSRYVEPVWFAIVTQLTPVPASQRCHR
jgi:hypothetical protein